jgi:hypothetical protein
MNRFLRCCVPVLCAGLVPILSMAAQTVPAPAPATPSAQTSAQNPAPAFKNLKVLPDTISRDDLRNLMRQFTGDLEPVMNLHQGRFFACR